MVSHRMANESSESCPKSAISGHNALRIQHCRRPGATHGSQEVLRAHDGRKVSTTFDVIGTTAAGTIALELSSTEKCSPNSRWVVKSPWRKPAAPPASGVDSGPLQIQRGCSVGGPCDRGSFLAYIHPAPADSRAIRNQQTSNRIASGLLNHPSGTGSLKSRNAAQHADGNRNKYRLSFYFMA